MDQKKSLLSPGRHCYLPSIGMHGFEARCNTHKGTSCFIAAVCDLQQAVCGYRNGISSGQLDLFSIKNDPERALKRNKDFFVGESMGIASCSWVNSELPGAEFCCTTTWGGEPKKVKAIEVKVWCLCSTGDGQAMGSLTVEQLEELRQEHIGRLLLRAQRAFNERALQKLRKLGHTRLSMVHTTLLPHLDVNGTQATILAERAGITKQAAGRVIADLEREGYVQRLPDPSDQRASMIIFTDAGRQFLVDAYQVKKAIEAEYTALLGAERMQQFRSILQELLGDNGPS